MPTRKFPISNPTASNGLPELNPGHVQGSRPIKLLGRGRTGIKHQSRTTAGGGARRPMRETGLKVYRRSVVVKASYRRSWSKIPWKAHARYLTREHAQTEHERGIGFDAGHDQVDMIGIVDRWQKEGTPLMWRVIISPDDHDRIDLREHIREVVAGMERDLGTKLEWTAIDHHPADHHDHVHLLIRGIRDDGKELILDRDYVTHGIKELSQSIIERDLGPRLEHEMLIARERGIHANYWTAIDAALQRRANDRVIAYEGTPFTQGARDRQRQEVERLVYLESIGLARSLGDSAWQLSPDHERTLRGKQKDMDIQKRREHERKHDMERDRA